MKRTNFTGSNERHKRLEAERRLKSIARKKEKSNRHYNQWVSEIYSVARIMIHEATKEFRRERIAIKSDKALGRNVDLPMHLAVIKYYGALLALDQMVHLLTNKHLFKNSRLNSYASSINQAPVELQKSVL